LAGSQAGSAAGIPPVPKTSRFDEVTKKPIPNLFNQEVMRALGTRGGPLWERLIKEDHLRASDAGQANAQVSWSEAIKNTSAVSEDINYYNKKFGLTSCPVKITKTLLNKITEAIERTDDGDRKITKKEFVQSVVSAGLSHLTADQYSTMFSAIDTDKSGEIDFEEWMEAVDPSFNEKFGLKDITCTYNDPDTGKEVTKKVMITKTLLNKITNALVWEKMDDDGTMGITEEGFVKSCTAAALSQLKPDQYQSMFKSIDSDSGGWLSKEEWTKAVEL
jgi:Ca2+-binding EF-hand superfamily protein